MAEYVVRLVDGDRGLDIPQAHAPKGQDTIVRLGNKSAHLREHAIEVDQGEGRKLWIPWHRVKSITLE